MVRLILFLNKLFRAPDVKGRESYEAYSEWEYEWGQSLVGEYLEPKGDIGRKKLLDIGCGFGGKTVAYGEGGATQVFGADLSVEKIAASHEFAGKKGNGFRWGFFAGDAAALPIRDGSFDTVVANDAMEHFADPEGAVREMVRVTKPGGAIWVFFTPHYSPLGSHLYDYIYTPWCHLLFSRESLQGAIREVLRTRNSGGDTQAIDGEVETIMRSFDNDLNHMSVRRFFGIIRRHPKLRVSFHELKPAKYPVLNALTKIPGLRELVTGTVVCRLDRVG